MARQQTDTEKQQKIKDERAKIEKGGFFHSAAVWILSRFPLTKERYQNWTYGRRVLVGWLLWLVCLPIIPAVAIALWYFNDPEGFKESPWAKGLIGLFVVWAGAFGFIATNQASPDINGIFSPTQTREQADKKSEKSTKKQDDKKLKAAEEAKKEAKDKDQAKESGVKQAGKAAATGAASMTAFEKAKQKVQELKDSKPSNGRMFENCTEAFEAGVFNIKRGDKSYQEKLDRDGDGVACER